jgi:hypothetical protein
MAAYVVVAALLGAVTARSAQTGPADPLFGIRIPQGYRDWPLVSVAVLGSPFNDMRAKVGNDIAMRAFRAGTLPYPNGSIVVRLAWKQVASAENNEAFRREGHVLNLSPGAVAKLLSRSFVAGPATNVQIMVKNSKRYASTGGWGFAQFDNGEPVSPTLERTCWPCHAQTKPTDFVFTRYSP